MVEFLNEAQIKFLKFNKAKIKAYTESFEQRLAEDASFNLYLCYHGGEILSEGIVDCLASIFKKDHLRDYSAWVNHQVNEIDASEGLNVCLRINSANQARATMLAFLLNILEEI